LLPYGLMQILKYQLNIPPGKTIFKSKLNIPRKAKDHGLNLTIKSFPTFISS